MTIRNWSLIGAATMIPLGSLLHFVFAWTNESRIIGAMVPVNESVWEHLKLGYLALVLYSIFEYADLHKRVNNYFMGKLIGILALEITILCFSYSYTLFTHRHILWIDILSFVIGILICQFLTWKIITKEPFPKWVNIASAIGMISLGILFAVFTYHPPHQEIFMDHNTADYGIFNEQ